MKIIRQKAIFPKIVCEGEELRCTSRNKWIEMVCLLLLRNHGTQSHHHEIRSARIATETPSQLPTRDEVLLHANSARSRSWKSFRQAPFDKLARKATMHAAKTLKPETLLVERTSSMPCARNP